MNRIAFNNIVFMSLGLGFAFGASRLIVILLDIKDIWPPNTDLILLLCGASLILETSVFAYVIRSTASVEKLIYGQSLVNGVLLGFPLFWFLVSIEYVFKFLI